MLSLIKKNYFENIITTYIRFEEFI